MGKGYSVVFVNSFVKSNFFCIPFLLLLQGIQLFKLFLCSSARACQKLTSYFSISFLLVLLYIHHIYQSHFYKSFYIHTSIYTQTHAHIPLSMRVWARMRMCLCGDVDECMFLHVCNYVHAWCDHGWVRVGEYAFMHVPMIILYTRVSERSLACVCSSLGNNSQCHT